jgi:hypothetical protein
VAIAWRIDERLEHRHTVLRTREKRDLVECVTHVNTYHTPWIESMGWATTDVGTTPGVERVVAGSDESAARLPDAGFFPRRPNHRS